MTDLIGDSVALVSHCGAGPDVVRAMGPARAREYLGFRLRFLQEELDETARGHSEGDPEAVVDGLVDLVVVALGTLVAFGVDVDAAWRVVQTANMSKVRGVNPSRPNPTGLPDLLKPEGWVAPDHSGNTGLLHALYWEDDSDH